MTNGMLWNIHKISRYGDTYMILDNNVLKFNGDLAIEKVNVSINIYLPHRAERTKRLSGFKAAFIASNSKTNS